MYQPALGAVHQRWVFLAVLAQDVAFRALGRGEVRRKNGFRFGFECLCKLISYIEIRLETLLVYHSGLSHIQE